MTARWSFAPVCGAQFWWVIVDVARGPDLPVLHDHRPEDGAGRAGGAARLRRGVAVVSTLLIAPQTTEFGSKVALLAGLVVMCVARSALREAAAGPGIRTRPAGRLRRRAGRAGRGVSRARPGARARGDRRRRGRAAGDRGRRGGGSGPGGVRRDERLGGKQPARRASARRSRRSLHPSAGHRRPRGASTAGDLTRADAQAIAVTLAENLEVEAQALRRGEQSLLAAVDDGSA